MVNFIVYDLIFLVVFALIAIFLFHKYRSSWKRHGWIFLYHSKFGLKFIDAFAKRFEKILRPLQYLVIASGYILMALIIWIMGLSVWRYVTAPIPEQLQSVPPIAPLIPYFPRLFNLDAFFPPLFFTYFLIALAIVAISHEFSHGIFARLHKIKVKTTGLAFFGPFFGAFVEPDEKQMAKKGKIPQLAILAAGTFANVLMTVLFLFVLWGFFSVSFMPAGVNFNTYPQAVVNVSDITTIEGRTFSNLDEIRSLIDDGEFIDVTIGNGEIFLVPGETLLRATESGAERVIVFQDTPAARNQLRSPILSIDGEQITSRDVLAEKLSSYEPKDVIEIVSLDEDVEVIQKIELAERDGNAFLGVGFAGGHRGGISGLLFGFVQEIRDPWIHYEPAWDGEFVQFIYDLLWWIVVINILVALFNMLPVSILDGGRFFYLTVWGITKNEKFGKKAYGFATWFIVALLIIMMIRWVFGFI